MHFRKQEAFFIFLFCFDFLPFALIVLFEMFPNLDIVVYHLNHFLHQNHLLNVLHHQNFQYVVVVAFFEHVDLITVNLIYDVLVRHFDDVYPFYLELVMLVNYVVIFVVMMVVLNDLHQDLLNDL